jgi:hypothetical protein
MSDDDYEDPGERGGLWDPGRDGSAAVARTPAMRLFLDLLPRGLIDGEEARTLGFVDN